MSIARAASKKVTPALRARFVQLVEKAERRGEARIARRLTQIADKRGEEGLALVARYHELKIPPKAPKPADKFPAYTQHQAYVDDLVGGKTPLASRRVFADLMQYTDPRSGTHGFAKALDQLAVVLPGRDWFVAAQKGFDYYPNNLLAGTLEFTEGQVAAQTGKTILRFNNLSREELKVALEFVKGMPGLTDSVLRHVANAEEQVGRLVPKLLKPPGAVGRIFGRGPKVDPTVEGEITRTFRDALTRVTEIREPAAGAAATAVDVNGARRTLLEDLLNFKINKTEEWKVFSAETWLKFQESSVSSSSGHVSGSARSDGVSLLFAKAQDTRISGSIAASGSSRSEGKLVKAVDLPIPHTDAKAPMVTVHHILANDGDYILVSGGKLHAVNGKDVDGWFAVAEKEIRSASRVLGTR